MTNPPENAPINPEKVIMSIGDIVYFQGVDGSLKVLNNASERILGFTQKELNEKNRWEKLFHTEDLHKKRKFLEKRPKTAKQIIVQYRVKHKDGHWVWLESRLFNVINDQGDPIGYQGIARDISQERKRTAQENEQNKRLEEAYKIAKITPFEIDLQKNQILISESFSKMIGIPPGWQPQELLNELIHPDDLQKISEEFNQCLKNRKYFTGVYRLKLKGKTEIKYFSSRGYFEYGNNGIPLRYIGTKQDITEKVIVEKKLLQSQEMLDDMGKIGRIGGWRIDFPSGQSNWTRTVHDLLKIPYNQPPPNLNKYLDHYPPEAKKEISRAMQQLEKNGKSFDLELPVYDTNKNIFWVRVIGEPVKNHTKVIGAKGSIQDITARKNTEIALKESEKKYKVLAESSHDYIMHFDKQARILYVNESIKNDWDLTDDQLIGKNHIEILGESEKAKKFVSAVKEIIKNKKARKEIIKAPDKTGNYRYLDWRLYPVLDRNGDVDTVLSVSRDITEQFISENELRNINEQLSNTIKSVPGAVYKIREDNNLEFISSQIRQITGYEPKSFIEENIDYKDLIVENDREMAGNVLNKAAENLSDFELSYRIRSRYGKEKWIWEKGLFTEFEGKIERQGFLMDITDRLRQEDRIISATLQAEDAERRRIAKEIHDGVQQTLVSSLMNLQSLEKYFEESVSDPSISDQYKDALKRLQEGVAETKNIAHSIMPKSIQDFGLVKTIESLIYSIRNHSEIDFSFYENLNDFRLNDKVETCFYRITQEAINNTLKYSQATEASIQLMKYDDIIILTIEDNGKGFDANEKNLLYSGLGISSMKSRASAVGAGIEITSQPGKGTNILVEIPLELAV